MKKSFYLKYIEHKEKIKKENKTKQKYKLDDNTIIIERSSNFFIRLLNILINGMKDVFKWVLYILLMIFVSIGVTAVINPSIRLVFINLIVGGN